MKNTTKIVIAFIAGISISIGSSVYGALLIGLNGVVEVPKVVNTTPQVTTYTAYTAPEEPRQAIQSVITPIKQNTQIQQLTLEEARLRAIESRLSALESKVK